MEQQKRCEVEARLKNDVQSLRLSKNATHYYGTDKDRLADDIEYLIKGRIDIDKAIVTLTNCCQLLDGWHSDGIAWSEWDSHVRQDVSSLLKECYETKAAAAATGSAGMPHQVQNCSR